MFLFFKSCCLFSVLTFVETNFIKNSLSTEKSTLNNLIPLLL